MKKLLSIALVLLTVLGCIPMTAVSFAQTEQLSVSENSLPQAIATQSGDVTVSYTDKKTFQNPVANGADPFVFKDTDGTYYMYTTNSSYWGYIGYTSRDLVNWSSIGYVFKKGDITLEGETTITANWAPEVFKHNGKYYMIASLNEYLTILSSSSPAGPFTTSDGGTAKKLFSYKSIDGHMFIDDDGQAYLYYVKCAHDSGLGAWGNVIYGCKFNLSTMKPVSGTETRLIAPSSSISWENGSGENIAEGPAIIKRNGKYYMLYTCNGYTNKAYAVGVAQATSPLGSYSRQSNNPVLIGSESVGAVGVGHCCYTTSPDGKEYWMVYHKHPGLNQIENREICLDKITFDSSGRLVVSAGYTQGKPTTKVQAYPSGAVSTLKDATLTGDFKKLTSLPTVYVHMYDGSDSNAGTQAKPYKTLDRAYDALTPSGGTIVLLASHDISSSGLSTDPQIASTKNYFQTPKDITGPIMLRGLNPGIRLRFNYITINSDHYIDNLMLRPEVGDATIECAFNNVTFGENISVSPYYNGTEKYPFLLGGYYQCGRGLASSDSYMSNSPFSYWKQSSRPYSVVSTNEDYTITVNGGTWRSIMGGNWRVRGDASVGLINANVTLNLGGTCTLMPVFSNSGDNNYLISVTSHSALSSSGTATLNVYGGTYNGTLYVNGKIGTVTAADGVTHASASQYHAGDSYANIYGGVFNSVTVGTTAKRAAVMATLDNGHNVTGDYTLVISKNAVFNGTESLPPKFWISNGDYKVTGTTYAYYGNGYSAYVTGCGYSSVFNLGDESMPNDNRVVFVASDGTGDGSSPSSPLSSITSAYQKLGGLYGGTVVVCGDFNLQSHFTEPAHSAPITVTQKWNGVDYSGSSAFNVVSTARRWIVNGPTKFENMKFNTTNEAGLLIMCQYNPVEIGTGVVCEGFDGSLVAKAITLIGGKQSGVTPSYSERKTSSHIVVRSGSDILIVGLDRGMDTANTNTANIQVYGGEIGCIYGGNVTSSVETAVGGAANITLAGGTYKKTIDCGYNVSGKVDLTIKDGNFSSCPAIKGNGDNSSATVYSMLEETVVPKMKEFGKTDIYSATVYVAHGASGDGSSASSPMGNLSNAYKTLGKNGGTIVVCGNITLSATFVEPSHVGKVTVTAKNNGTSYPGVIKTNGSAAYRYELNGPTTFENMTFDGAGQGILLVASYNRIELGEGIVCKNFSGTEVTKSLSIIGGKNSGTSVTSAAGGSDITVRSGTDIIIAGGNRYVDTAHTRKATINILGGEINALYGGNINASTSGSAEINISGGKLLGSISCASDLTGDVVLNITGGDFSSCPAIKGNAALNCKATVADDLEDSLVPIISGFGYIKTASGYIKGDIDCNGAVANSDITTLVRYLSGFADESNEKQCDYNCDGKINNRDAIALISKLAG